jgi:predicted nucleic acid-binding protein
VTALMATVVDTDVFSVLYLRRGSADPRGVRWREQLTGRRVLISFQTRAEVLAGAVGAGWGDRRLGEARDILDRTPTIRPDNEVIDAYAALVAECRRAGHGLQDQLHAGHRWVAACAIAKNLDLLAGDGIYLNAPNLSLLN